MSPFFCCFYNINLYFMQLSLYLLQLSLKKKNQTNKHTAVPCHKKNSKGKNDSLDGDGFSGKGTEKGHGTKLLCKIRHGF